MMILSLACRTSKTEFIIFSARRISTPFVPPGLPDQKNLYLESFPFTSFAWFQDKKDSSAPGLPEETNVEAPPLDSLNHR